MSDSSRSLRSRVLVSPEFNVGLFAFLLNYPWEFLQVPFFEAMPEMAHWEAVVFCTRATLGDVLIALVAYGLVAMVLRNRAWVRQPGTAAMTGFVLVGVLITIGLEWHATEIQGRWQYGELMPTLPLLGTGLTPMLQWILLPPLVVWLVRRQMLGQERLSGTSASTAK